MALSIESFETPRLRAERIAETHFGELDALGSDPVVMANLGGARSADKNLQMLRLALNHWNQYGFGRWVWTERQTGKFVGICGLRCMTIDGWPEVSLGYRLRADSWGKGYATEMAGRVVRLAFEQLGMESVVALAFPENLPSIRVMKKIGMRFHRDATVENLPHVLYEITRAEWAARQNPQ